MIQQQTDNYIKICMKAWLLCESSIHAELNRVSPRYDLIQECTSCAKACFAVVSKLVSNADDLSQTAFDCLLHCRQCCEECDKYPEDEDLVDCAEVCYKCADAVKALTQFSLN